MKVTEKGMQDADIAVFEEVKEVAERFAALGPERVNEICNARRQELLGKMSATLLRELGLPGLDLAIAHAELGASFNTQPVPDELVLDFSVRSREENPQCPMSALRPTIWVHMNALGALGALGLTVKKAVLHEMLHVCGETEHDGILRHNAAGVFPLYEVLYP